jgi:glycosyltransferase involved in cell wall biosynthesis
VSGITAASVSVVVCTRNRASLLDGCLARLATLDPAPREILVVDQGDDDAAAQVVLRHRERLANLRHLPSSSRGLSRARNVGIAHARGEILAFTDDDCLVRSDWVASLARAFAQHPEVAAVTGGSLPEDADGADPRIVAAATWHPAAPRLYRSFVDPAVVGGGFNLSFRKDWAERIGRFDADLGPGARFRGADDTDFIHRILHAGGSILYDPGVVVAHLPWRSGAIQSAVEWEYGHGIAVWALKRLRQRDFFPARVALGVFATQARRAVGGVLRHDGSASRTGWSYVRGMCRGAASWLLAPSAPADPSTEAPGV